MGFRTLVILHNDRTGEWSKDPKLGEKIAQSMSFAMGRGDKANAHFGYGSVVECCHADTQTLGVVNSYGFQPLAFSHWYASQTDEEMKLQLLKEAADAMGYRLTKKPTTK